MLSNSLPTNTIDFKTLEKEIYHTVLEFGRAIMKAILESIDKELRFNDKFCGVNSGFKLTHFQQIKFDPPWLF